jgi:probable F420-dependent oxidoreductase
MRRSGWPARPSAASGKSETSSTPRATSRSPAGHLSRPVRPCRRGRLVCRTRSDAPGSVRHGAGRRARPQAAADAGRYLDALDTVAPTVPAAARVLAALGPACSGWPVRARPGRIPCWSRPSTPRGRGRCWGEDAALVVGQFVIVDADPERARALARGPLGFMTAGAGSGYAANLRRMGFAEEEIARVSDRLVDAMVAWGELDAVAVRVREHLRAGG